MSCLNGACTQRLRVHPASLESFTWLSSVYFSGTGVQIKISKIAKVQAAVNNIIILFLLFILFTAPCGADPACAKRAAYPAPACKEGGGGWIEGAPGLVPWREKGTGQIGTILRFASVPLKKIGTLLLYEICFWTRTINSTIIKWNTMHANEIQWKCAHQVL